MRPLLCALVALVLFGAIVGLACLAELLRLDSCNPLRSDFEP